VAISKENNGRRKPGNETANEMKIMAKYQWKWKK
jgi:hypothetical protein